MKNTATWFVSSLALLTSCNYASSKPTLNSSKDSLFNILHSTSVKENLEEKAEILTLLTEAPTQQSEEENKSIFPYERLIETVYEPIIYGNLTKPEIALTFDDGHNKEAIKNILKLLKERDVKVTFFLIGKCIKLHKQLWEQAILDGHQICNHTHTHPYLQSADSLLLRKEIMDWEQTVCDVLGEEYLKKMKREFPFFRFPGGKYSKHLIHILKEYGYLPIGWSHEHCFTTDPGNGSIILFHFNKGEEQHIEDYLNKSSRSFQSISNVLLGDENYVPIGWKNLSIEQKKAAKKLSEHINSTEIDLQSKEDDAFL